MHDFLHTDVRLPLHPLSAPLAPTFSAFFGDWKAAFEEELLLIRERYSAQAGVEFTDEELNKLVEQVVAGVLLLVNNDRSALDYLRYFGKLKPHEVKKFMLGEQVEIMRAWPPSLKTLPSPMLQDVGAQIEQKVVEADGRTSAKNAVEQKYTDFRMTGTRRKLIEKFNALRKKTFGNLSDIQHAHPELGSDWAVSFFRQSSAAAPLGLREVERRIATAELELTALKKQRDELMAEEETAARAKAEAERAKKQAELASAKKAAEDAAARIAMLEAELEQKK